MALYAHARWLAILLLSGTSLADSARLVRSPRANERIPGLEPVSKEAVVVKGRTGPSATVVFRFDAANRTLVYGVQPVEPKLGVYTFSVPLTDESTVFFLLAASPDGTLKEERLVLVSPSFRKPATAPAPEPPKLTSDPEVRLAPAPVSSTSKGGREKEESFRVTKPGENREYVAILFKGMGWQLGDRLCVNLKSRPKACGTVVTRLAGRVRVKYETPQPELPQNEPVEVTAEYLPRFLASVPDRRVLLSPGFLVSGYSRKSLDVLNGTRSELAARLNLGLTAQARLEWSPRFDSELQAILMRDSFVKGTGTAALQDGEQTLFGAGIAAGYRFLEERTLRVSLGVGIHEQSVLRALTQTTLVVSKSWIPRARLGLQYLLPLSADYALDFRGAGALLFSGSGDGYAFNSGNLLEASFGLTRYFEGWSLGGRAFFSRLSTKTSIVEQDQNEPGFALSLEQRI